MKNNINEYWRAYSATQPPGSPIHNKPFIAEQLGDNPGMADYLGNLITIGRKTATCSALWELEASGMRIPEVGLVTIVLNGDNQPLCIIETTEVHIKPYNEVDAQFAYDEGEGDRSLTSWRRVHWDYFTRILARIGKTPTLDMPLVCERFRVIYK
ncbi:MAG: ASCH domain-containing protein [FCB group bacterium]|nr:ASCH domain-containing protein [FCB group bacterium]